MTISFFYYRIENIYLNLQIEAYISSHSLYLYNS